MMRKLISLRGKLKNTSLDTCDSLLSDNYKMIHAIACLNSEN
jgi:hypothetical protein